MDKATVIRLRKELHQMSSSDRANPEKKIDIPLMIMFDGPSVVIDEMTSCIIWDDANEALYSIEYNNDIHPLGTICPMRVRAFSYDNIYSITARVDMNCLMNFFDSKIGDGLTTEETKKKYHALMQKMSDPNAYAMGMPSTTTTKEEFIETSKDSPLLNPTAYNCL